MNATNQSSQQPSTTNRSNHGHVDNVNWSNKQVCTWVTQVLRDANEDENDVETTTKLIRALNWKGQSLLATQSEAVLEQSLDKAYRRLHNETLPLAFDSIIKILWASIQKLKVKQIKTASTAPHFIFIPRTTGIIGAGEPFVDRLPSVVQFIHIQINNLVKLKQQDFSNQKFTTVLSAQAFGSGKTYFAQHVQQYAQNVLNNETNERVVDKEQYEKYRNELIELQENHPHEFSSVLNAKYILWDFRRETRIHKTIEDYFKNTLIMRLIEETGSNSEDIQHFDNIPLGSISVQAIVKYFASRNNCSFFFHFDEIHALPSMFEHNISLYGSYYMFWNLITELYFVDCCTYLSGRSTHLLAIGKGVEFPEREKITSPGSIILVTHNCFEVEHVEELYNTRNNAFSMDDPNLIQFLCNSLWKRTGGVPRLLRFAFQYLDTKLLDLSSEQKIEEALGDKLYDYLWDEANLYPELNPVGELDKMQKNGYYSLILAAAFQIPFPRTHQYPAKLFGLDLPVVIDVREAANTLAFYFREDIDNGTTVLVLPELVMQCISDRNDDPMLCLYGNRFKMIRSTLNHVVLGKHFEVAIQECLLMHILIATNLRGGSTLWSEIFSWLKESYLADVRLTPLKFRRFPKVTSKAAELSRPNNRSKFFKKYENKAEELRQMLQSDTEVLVKTMHPNDWKAVGQLLNECVLYCPLAMSSSADLFLLITRILVSLQLKYGQQVIDNNLIGKELAKFPLNVQFDNIEKHTIILMGFNFSSEIERKMEQSGYVRFTEGETFRYTTNKDRTTQEIKLGKHQEVLVINQANLEHFLGKTNYHLFKKHLDEPITPDVKMTEQWMEVFNSTGKRARSEDAYETEGSASKKHKKK